MKNDILRQLQQTIEINPHDVKARLDLAKIYAKQGDRRQALAHYAAAVQEAPDSIEIHYNLGLFFLNEGEFAHASTQFNNVLTLCPNHPQALFYLGALQLEANQLDAAERTLEQLLTHQPEHVKALINVGVIALKREQAQTAIDYFTRALALDNTSIEARNNLAATFIHHDRFENALVHYDELLQTDPHNLEYRYNSGVAEMALGHLQEAMIHFNDVLSKQPHHVATLRNLAAITLRLEDRKSTMAHLQHLLTIDPQDTASQFMLHALSQDNKHPAACNTYILGLFDQYATQYDQHMQTVLQYTLPHQIVRVLHQLPIQSTRHTLDLGCGTGLSGIALRELSKQLTGVDLSPHMIAEARKKNNYDRLIQSDLVDFLIQDNSQYDLIVAADVLPYMGDLTLLFKHVVPRLSTQGLFVFTTEISEDDAWQLQTTARFSHSTPYIHSLCNTHHLTCLYEAKHMARQQAGEPLYVMLYVVQI